MRQAGRLPCLGQVSAHVVHHAAADAVTVHHNRAWPLLKNAHDDLSANLDRVHATNLVSRDSAQALPVADHRLIVAKPRYVHAEDLVCPALVAHVALAGICHHVTGDELAGPGPWELTLDADADTVRVLAPVLYFFGNLDLVRAGNRAGIDLAPHPAMLEASKALSECASILGWIAERQPDDLCILVGQCAASDFPYLVRNRAGLIVDHDNTLAFVVQSLECFGVVFAPRLAVNTPRISMCLIFNLDSSRCAVPPVRVNGLL